VNFFNPLAVAPPNVAHPILLAAGLAFVAGCGATPTVVAAPLQSRGTQALPFEGARIAGRLYASDGDRGAMYVFGAGSGHKLIRQFGQFSSPTSIATDASGNLYVQDWGQGSYDGHVYVIAPGKSTPFLTLDDTGALPSDIAIDAAGTVYVANGYDQQSCGSSGDVRVYTRGATKAAYTICDSGIGQPYSQVNGVAVDTKGDVFVTWENAQNTGGRVREFSPGPNYKGRFLPPTFGYPSAVAIDSANDLVVSDVRLPGVEVFSRGGKTLKYSFARTGDPLHVAFDASGEHLFVADALANQIGEYEYATGVLVHTIAFPGSQLDGVAISPKGP
jgi:DNA-binding beta-propeller fold protein YncE